MHVNSEIAKSKMITDLKKSWLQAWLHLGPTYSLFFLTFITFKKYLFFTFQNTTDIVFTYFFMIRATHT